MNKMDNTKSHPVSLSILAYNTFKDKTPLPCKLATINDDALTVHIMITMIEPGKNISSVAIELGKNLATFAAVVAHGLKDATAKKNFYEISDLIDSIRWTDDDDIFVKIQNQVEPFKDNREYKKLVQQLMTILHTGFTF